MTLERVQQVRAHFDALQLRAWSHAVTLRLAIVTDNRESSYQTASGVLMQFGARVVVGTAWHVLTKLQSLRADGHEVVLICENMPIFTHKQSIVTRHATLRSSTCRLAAEIRYMPCHIARARVGRP